METSEAFEILGLPSTATPAQIKEAYRDLSKVWHPDRFGSDARLQAKAEESLKRINEAYQFLQDPSSRRSSRSSRARSDPSGSPAPASNAQRSRWQTRYWIYAAIALGLIPLPGSLLIWPEKNRQPTTASPISDEPQAKSAVSSAPPHPGTAGPAAGEKPRPSPRSAPSHEREIPSEIPASQSPSSSEASGTGQARSTDSAASALPPLVPSPDTEVRVPSDATFAAKDQPEAFVKMWMGRTVVVKTTIYSLIFNERGTLGRARRGLHEGLVVVTPFQGTYLQFDGRQGRDAVVERDPGRVIGAVSTAYEPDSLDVRSYRKVEPLAVNRYEPGAELVVSGVRVDRDRVRLEFVQAGVGGDAAVTSVRIQWPVALSTSFTERGLVENLIRRFVEIQQP